MYARAMCMPLLDAVITQETVVEPPPVYICIYIYYIIIWM